MRPSIALVFATGCSLPSLSPIGDAVETGGPNLIAGTVNGLSGNGLVLQNNGADNQPIITSGGFEFATRIARGANYAVTVAVQPTDPSQLCTVVNDSGIADADVSDVTVNCVAAFLKIGGSATGITSGVMLQNSGGEVITVSSNGLFSFQTPVRSGLNYSVQTTGNVPAGCRLSGNTGVVGVGVVSSIVLNCDATRVTVGGSVTGLDGTLVLKNSANGDTVTLNQTGTSTYAFPMTMDKSTGSYNAVVMRQPSYPPESQTCTVANGAGGPGVPGPIENVDVTCVPNQFSVGGTITGVAGTVVLQNNGSDDLSLSANGSFTFPTRLSSAHAYRVTVLQAPANLRCTVTNGTGAVGGANVTDIAVACGP
jgi:hypothetical protein